MEVVDSGSTLRERDDTVGIGIVGASVGKSRR
jgi:hypothetical protein